MPQPLFYIFAILAAMGAFAMVCFKNPVASALSMVASFLGLASLFVGLNAYFVGIIQILVYAGAIMVLFIFIIMLLDLKSEERKTWKPATITAAIAIPLVLVCQLFGVLQNTNNQSPSQLDFELAATNYDEGTAIRENLDDGQLPDVHLVGRTLFAGHGEQTSHNFPLQIMGILLLVATIGVVVLSKRTGSDAPAANTDN